MKASLHSSDSKTLPLTVSNTGFLLDRLGQDCHPLQFLRELTQNAIEAFTVRRRRQAKSSGTSIGCPTNWNLECTSCPSPTPVTA
jgi:hypothetical protein